MDFTYIVAAFISVVVGAVGGCIFVLAKGQSLWRLLVVAVPIAVVMDFALLLDWSRTESMMASFFLTDLAFFTIYALVGCCLGALPIFAVWRFYRRLIESDAD